MAKTPGFKITRSIPDLIAKQGKPSILPETGWWKVGASEGHNVVFLNSWGNVGVLAGVTNAPVSWYLSEDGEVRLRGKIDGGSVGTVVCVLPEEVRPEFAETFICAVDGGLKANVTVHANGEVKVDSIS